MASRVNPGPEDTSLLHLQPYHVSEHLWHGAADRFLRVRRAQKHKHVDPPAGILPYLQAAGFNGLAHLGYFPVDNVLISALVERWRPETHTFHILTGECTITLEDVGILTGLPVDGTAVTGHSNLDWKDLCDRLLGVVPPDHALSGGRLRMSWLDTMHDHIPDDADDEFLQRYARAYILRLIGGMLFPDHSGRFVHLMYLPLLSDFTIAGTYSWGSACLSYLYRELCKATDYDMHEIGGACFLLQIWAWFRFPRLAPTLSDDNTTLDNYELDRAHLRPFGFKWHRHKMLSETSTHLLKYYRHHFDHLKKDEIVWQPYTEDIISTLPAFCTTGSDIWRAVVPLICFHIVEWHQPDRVLRQFELDQPIPRRPRQPEHLHSITLKGRHDDFWPDVHKDYIALWDTRRELCINGRALDGALSARSDYMRWYKRITRRWISPTTATLGVVADVAEQLYGWATEFRSGFSMDSLRQSAELILFALDEHDRIARTQLQTPPAGIIPGPSEDDYQDRATHRRRCGLAENRKRVQPSDSAESSSHHPPHPTVTAAYSTPPIQPPPSYYLYPPYPYPLLYPYPPSYPYPPPYPYPSQPGYPPYPHPSQPGSSSNPSYRPP